MLQGLASHNDESFRARYRNVYNDQDSVNENDGCLSGRHFHSCSINHNVNIPTPPSQKPSHSQQHRQQFYTNVQVPIYQSFHGSPGSKPMLFTPVFFHNQAYPTFCQQPGNFKATQNLPTSTVSTIPTYYDNDIEDFDNKGSDEIHESMQPSVSTDEVYPSNIPELPQYQTFQRSTLKKTSSKLDPTELTLSLSPQSESFEVSKSDSEVAYIIHFKP